MQSDVFIEVKPTRNNARCFFESVATSIHQTNFYIDESPIVTYKSSINIRVTYLS